MSEKMKILVCDPIPIDSIDMLTEAGFEVDLRPSITSHQLRNVVSDYDILIVRSRTKVTKEIIESGEKLKAIGRAGSGLDNIDIKTAEKRGVNVLSAPEAPADSVAELTIGLMISMVRRIPFADRTMKEGKWIKRELMACQLKGKTLGIIGLGNIGKKVARIARSLGMKIIVTKRTAPSPKMIGELEAEYIPLEDFSSFLQRSDIITLHVPLTPQTRHMISSKEFHQMKDGAFIINTSRGGIIDQKALLEALQSKKLAGAAMDVYQHEPPNDLRLVRLTNVICTPHIGNQTYEAMNTASNEIVMKLIKMLRT